LQKWAAEVAATGTFSAPLGSSGPGGLPVPYLVIGNKADIAAKEGTRGSSGNLVDAARQWVEKQGLLPSSEELPLTETFPGRTGLVAVGNPFSIEYICGLCHHAHVLSFYSVITFTVLQFSSIGRQIFLAR